MPRIAGLNVFYEAPGLPTEQQRVLFETAVTQSLFDWTRLLDKSITVTWVDLDPDLNDPVPKFVTATNDGVTRRLSIHHELDSLEEPYAGAPFYHETVLSGLGQMVWLVNIRDMNLFTRNRVRKTLIEGGEAEQFGIGEIFKDIYSTTDNRRYNNRSDWNLTRSGFESFVISFQDELPHTSNFFNRGGTTRFACTQSGGCPGTIEELGGLGVFCPEGVGDGNCPNQPRTTGVPPSTGFDYPCVHHDDVDNHFAVTPGQGPLPRPEDFSLAGVELYRWLDTMTLTAKVIGGGGTNKRHPCNPARWMNGASFQELLQFGETINGVGVLTNYVVNPISGGGASGIGADSAESSKFTPGTGTHEFTPGSTARNCQARSTMLGEAGSFTAIPLDKNGNTLVDKDGDVIYMDYILLSESFPHPGFPYGVEGEVFLQPSMPGSLRKREKSYSGVADRRVGLNVT